MILKELSYLRRSDRLIVIVALTVAVVALTLLYVLDGEQSPSAPAASAPATADGPRTGRRGDASATYTYAVEDVRRPERFAFDPNTADSTALLRLGLRPWQVRAIYRYRAHGGVYRQPSDFARLYGLTAGEYRELEPYIRIAGDYRPAAEIVGQERAAAPDTVRRHYKIDEGERVDLNTADTALLQRVPGIGSYYARQIVRRREWLGGFASPAQLAEIDGFPETAVHYFTASPSGVRKVRVNALTLSQLRRHPYINFYQARAITDYRRLKGPLRDVSDLKRLSEFSESDLARLAPYLEF